MSPAVLSLLFLFAIGIFTNSVTGKNFCPNETRFNRHEHSTRVFQQIKQRRLFPEILFVCDQKFTQYFYNESELLRKVKVMTQFAGILLLELNVTLLVKDIIVVPENFHVGEPRYGIDHYIITFNKTIHKKYYDEYKYDGAILLSGYEYDKSGAFIVGGICNENRIGGVFPVEDSKLRDERSVSETIAHEIGHGLGLEHDTKEKSGCDCQRCVMAPGHDSNTVWSECSKRDIKKLSLDCALTGCGNGIVESGEDCDCGSDVEKCPCCNVRTCKLMERDNSCDEDLEEMCKLGGFCDGKHFDRCENSSRPNGTLCSNGRRSGKCYLGTCKIL